MYPAGARSFLFWLRDIMHFVLLSASAGGRREGGKLLADIKIEGYDDHSPTHFVCDTTTRRHDDTTEEEVYIYLSSIFWHPTI